MTVARLTQLEEGEDKQEGKEGALAGWGHGHEARSALQLRFGFGFASSLAEHIKGKTTKHLSG